MDQASGTIVSSDAPRLTALDRCDSCGAQAYVRVEMSNGELLFCAHHAAQHQDKLKPVAISWQDETHRLFESNNA